MIKFKLRIVNMFLLSLFLFHISAFCLWAGGLDEYRSIQKQIFTKYITSYKQQHGHTIDLLAFNQYLMSKRVKSFAIKGLVDIFIASQKPLISKDNLRVIYKAKIDSLKTYRSEYLKKKYTQGKLKSYEKGAFAFAGDNIYSERKTGKRIDKLKLEVRQGFDGKYWKSMVNSKGKYYGDISENQQRQGIYNTDMPLKLSMLQRSPDPDSSHVMYDIFKFLDEEGSFIQEEPVLVDRKKFLLLSSGSFSAYLDPQLGYAVVLFESYVVCMDDSTMSIKGIKTNYRRVCSDFIDFSNDMYLPNKVEEFWFNEDGKVWQKNESEIIIRNINKPVPVKLFKDIIGDGVVVNDFVKNICYVRECPDDLEKDLLSKSSTKGQAVIKTLIVDGQNNHKWQATTPVLKSMMEKTVLFKVDVSTCPSKGKDMSSYKPEFTDYDLVVVNDGWGAASWSDKTKRAFEDFVRSGGGVVIYHAADNCWPKWKAYNEIIGIGGWGGRNEKSGPYLYMDKQGKVIRDMSPGKGGGHGKQERFLITVRNPDHPITRGLPKTFMHGPDEMYAFLRGPAKNVTILATAHSSLKNKGTGHEEPMLMTITWGKGRIFHTVLGHAVKQISQNSFKFTFLRGAQWAAGRKVTIAVPKGAL